MVVKLPIFRSRPLFVFESSVISYGSEAYRHSSSALSLFESSVISYGSETSRITGTNASKV